MIFASLGSNYSFKVALELLLAHGKASDVDNLTKLLAQKYGGHVTLYHRGRSALNAALKLSGAAGDEVVVNGFTCYAVEQAVVGAGLEPVFADVEPGKFHFGPQELEKVITSKTKAIIVQNTFGIPCDILSIERICRQHRLLLIEDLAHSVGSVYSDGREAGTVGDFVMLSFGRDKLLDAVNGGALIVRHSTIKPPQPPTYAKP